MGKIGLEAFGLYATATSAEIALDRLIAAGYSRKDVSLLMTDAYATREAAVDLNAKGGAPTSSLIGGTLGSLDQIESLAIPGIGRVIAAGRIIRLLDVESADCVVNALMSMGMPGHEAQRCEDRVRDGEVLLAVHYEKLMDTHRVKTLLKESAGDGIAAWGGMTLRWRPMENDTPYAGAVQQEAGSF